ncbi:hypothetical protein Despr_1339 [Desulfobulbus propionicus DSM 2032]|uniref:Transmembrane protein n=1 Tax=Desulfobulbus propionicus (strain ATCC 33891 / DSM 2032 / VKM B-1956 / 1pr3) TaxID=577650 RepID=A0A7U3YLC2_DESPD|nr:hypothetical protein [Desulfobulbus propionicus]ADW17503.1 hypothetical protein Despr_1339 [Desulfobulbus propionicus DSM 2032]
MKNFLWFLLGFVSVFALCLNCKADSVEPGYPGSCTQWFYIDGGVVESSTLKTNLVGDVRLTIGETEMSYSAVTITSGYTWRKITLYGMFWNGTRWAYSVIGGLMTVTPECFSTLLSQGIISVSSNVTASFFAAKPGCTVDCLDSDSDGLCDVCDDNPYDSTVAGTKYLKGWYELSDGTVVAGIISYSAQNDNYDMISIYSAYNYPEKFPGLVYSIGSFPSYIDEKSFFAAGGRVTYLATPDKLHTIKCNTVSSVDQCTDSVCEKDTSDSGDSEILTENTTADDAEQVFPTTEQKGEDVGLMDLDKTCDDLKSKCSSSCGSSALIKNFACSENKHMICECMSNGQWELASDFNEVNQTIDNSTTNNTTNNYYGDGDTSTGGGSSTSVSGSDTDGDGDVDNSDGWTGSYQYVEGKFDYEGIASHFSQFTTKFPFSLRSTFKDIYSDFKGSGSAPVYTYSIYGKNITIDLSSFDNIAQMVRSLFALGITISTIVLLIYLYVGVDLRGK